MTAMVLQKSMHLVFDALVIVEDNLENVWLTELTNAAVGAMLWSFNVSDTNGFGLDFVRIHAEYSPTINRTASEWYFVRCRHPSLPRDQ